MDDQDTAKCGVCFVSGTLKYIQSHYLSTHMEPGADVRLLETVIEDRDDTSADSPMPTNGIDGNTLGKCAVCPTKGPLSMIQEHFLKSHVNNEAESSTTLKKKDLNGHENQTPVTPLHWTAEHVLLLIRLIEKYYSEFDTGLKKNVYIKISKEMKEVTNKTFTPEPEQIESKWKGLKKTYKAVKDHNAKTGNSHKRWQFFDAMNSFMAKKPEIEPRALCSSTSATITISETISKQKDDNIELASDDGILLTPKSILVRKRKHCESAIQKRHEEKLERYDQFLKLFKISVEHQVGRQIDD